jgi:hypothetical protein
LLACVVNCGHRFYIESFWGEIWGGNFPLVFGGKYGGETSRLFLGEIWGGTFPLVFGGNYKSSKYCLQWTDQTPQSMNHHDNTTYRSMIKRMRLERKLVFDALHGHSMRRDDTNDLPTKIHTPPSPGVTPMAEENLIPDASGFDDFRTPPSPGSSVLAPPTPVKTKPSQPTSVPSPPTYCGHFYGLKQTIATAFKNGKKFFTYSGSNELPLYAHVIVSQNALRDTLVLDLNVVQIRVPETHANRGIKTKFLMELTFVAAKFLGRGVRMDLQIFTQNDDVAAILERRGFFERRGGMVMMSKHTPAKLKEMLRTAHDVEARLSAYQNGPPYSSEAPSSEFALYRNHGVVPAFIYICACCSTVIHAEDCPIIGPFNEISERDFDGDVHSQSMNACTVKIVVMDDELFSSV